MHRWCDGFPITGSLVGTHLGCVEVEPRNQKGIPALAGYIG